MIKTTPKSRVICSKLVNTSETQVQLRLMDLAIEPTQVKPQFLEICPSTLKCHVTFKNDRIYVGKLKPKYRHFVMSHRLKLNSFKITGLDKQLNMKHRYMGINIELEILE